jgi:hypothetical protein
MNGQRTTEIAGAKRGRLVARAQGVPPSLLTFSSRRVMESQIGTSYNLPCLLETLPDAQTESGVFFETPGWSEPGGGDGSDVTFPTIDTTGATADSTLSTADQTI